MLGTLLILIPLGGISGAEPYYSEDFEQIQEGEVPNNFLVLEGDFAVKGTENSKVLELPGDPVGTFTCLMGPAKTENIAFQARIRGDRRKRRYPVFGIGLSGVSGYRLQINPIRRQVELLREEIIESTAPFRWKPGAWTFFRLSVVKPDANHWKVEGRVWSEGEKPEEGASVSYEDSEKPLSGRPSIWGIPYSEKPIQFDDLLVEPAAPDGAG